MLQDADYPANGLTEVHSAAILGVMTWLYFHRVATNPLLSSESVQQPSVSEALCGIGTPWDGCNWQEVYQNSELLHDLSYVPREARCVLDCGCDFVPVNVDVLLYLHCCYHACHKHEETLVCEVFSGTNAGTACR